MANETPIEHQKAVDFLGTIINHGGRFGFMPYTWNRKTGRSQFQHGSKPKIYFFLQLLLVLIYQIFLLYKCITILRSSTEKLQRKIRTFYMALVYVSLNVQHLITIKQFGSLHLLINNMLDLTQNIHCKYGPINLKGEKRVRCLMKMSVFVYLVGCSNAFGVFLAPKSPTLLTSLFHDPKNLSIAVKLIIAGVHIAVNLFHLYALAFYYSLLPYFVHAVAPVVRFLEFRCEIERQNKSKVPEIRLQPSQILKYYTQLAVLLRNFNHVFSIWTIGMEVLGILYVILNLFQAVEFNSIRSLIMGLAGCLCFVGLYSQFSKIHVVSTGTLASWKIISRPDWFSKYRRSCKPLSVTIGAFYYADNGLPLTILSIIFVNTANLIVTYSSKNHN